MIPAYLKDKFLPRPKNIPLRVVLIVPFVLLTTLAVGLTGYLSFRNGRQAVNGVAAQLHSEISVQIERELAVFLDTAQLINQINADAIQEGLVNPADSAALEGYFWRQVQLFKTVTSIYFGNPQGGLSNAGREGAGGFLYLIATDEFSAGPFRKYATDEQGNRTDLLATVPNFDSRARPWYTRAVESGQPAWSDIYILATGQDMALAASRPVYDSNGELLGVVSNDIFLSHLSNFLQNLTIGKTGEIFIIEHSGLLVASSTGERLVITAENGQPRRLSVTESNIPLVKEGFHQSVKQFGNLESLQRGQDFEFELEGRRYLAYVTPFHWEPNLNWLVVILVPEADFIAPLQANARHTLWLIMVALVVAIVAGIITARRVSQPLLNLNRAAKQLAKGNLTQPLKVDHIKEINELSQSFNTMTVQLTQSLEGMATEIAERKQIEAVLLQEKDFNQAAIDSLPGLFYLFDEDGRFLRWNKNFELVSGYSGQEIAHMSPLNFFKEPDKSLIMQRIKQVFSTGQATAEAKFISKDQTETPYFFTGKMTLSGEKPYLLGMGIDMTERKQAEEALRQNEARLRNIFETAAEGICSINELNTITLVNPQFAQMVGYSVDELNGKSFESLIPQKDISNFKNRVKDRRGGKQDVFERLLRRKDGSIIYTQVAASPLFAESGAYKGSFGLFTDITESRRAEEQLRESEARNRALLQAIPDLIFVQSRDGVFLDFHALNSDGLFTSPEAFLGKRMQDILPEAVTTALTAIFEQTLLTGQTQTYEYELPIADRSRYFEARVAPYGDDKLLSIVRETTGRKQLEARLLQAQKMEAVGRLAGGIAHDFNNILVPIIGYAELGMLKLSPDDKSYANLERIRKAADRAAGLVRQILAFSRRQVLEMRALDLNTVITDFSEMIRRLIGENIELQMFLEPSLYQVKADKGQLEQAILNLALNARDAMPEGGKLTIETTNAYLDEAYVKKHTEMQAPGYYAMLSVSDTGHGIDAATKERIFEPFFTTKEETKGTGLGLATVFGIIKQHGGNIWVYSEPGNGATFKIYLPQTKDTAQAPVITTTEEVIFMGGTETILVVEDEKMVRQLVCETLAAQGYKVIEAQGPTEALQLAAEYEETIHLLLTDVIMPDMNGKALYHKIAALYPGIRVLYMSGYTDNAIVHHGVLDGGVNFLQKPFTVNNLAQKVREAFG